MISKKLKRQLTHLQQQRQQQIEAEARREAAWQRSFAEGDFFDNEGRANIYTCEQCALVVWVVVMAKGITPERITCRREQLQGVACPGEMVSGEYRVCMTTLMPDYLFYRPSLKELEYMAHEAHELEYVQNGGLILALVQARPTVAEDRL